MVLHNHLDICLFYKILTDFMKRFVKKTFNTVSKNCIKFALIRTIISSCLNFEKWLNFFIKTFFNKSFIDSTPTKSPSDGVKYFFHFRKDFINPYGLAHDASSFSDQQISARLSQMNCEFLTRPNIALSEFAHTLLANIEYLEENASVLDGQGMAKFFRKVDNYKDALRILNSKNDAEGNSYSV